MSLIGHIGVCHTCGHDHSEITMRLEPPSAEKKAETGKVGLKLAMAAATIEIVAQRDPEWRHCADWLAEVERWFEKETGLEIRRHVSRPPAGLESAEPSLTGDKQRIKVLTSIIADLIKHPSRKWDAEFACDVTTCRYCKTESTGDAEHTPNCFYVLVQTLTKESA